MVTFPGESAEYRAARDDLLKAEMALRRQVEAVAAQRRALPLGGLVEKAYTFTTVAPGRAEESVDLPGLFTGGKDSLVVYGFMYADDGTPCPMCSAFLDSFDGAVPHITEQADVAIVAKTSASRIREWAEDRGWRNLPLYSSAGSDFNTDYHAESAAHGQVPMVNVFRRDGDAIRHVVASEMFFAPNEPGQNPRHVDMLWPLWNTLDLTPGGRGEWYPATRY
ncbi:MAG: DUF899 family protein [Alphaproteobacteria bacterium]|jgi:predicted dithiol-disulfide oxidoreductase (DUF899 family)|nr:DUF899 family protein [Alphaproteobacteria bacterium]